MMKKYKQVEECVCELDLMSLLDGRVVDAIERLSEIVDKYGDSVYFEADSGLVDVSYKRPETDKEYDVRVLKEAEALERKESCKGA